jgi:hypothetical protein
MTCPRRNLTGERWPRLNWVSKILPQTKNRSGEHHQNGYDGEREFSDTESDSRNVRHVDHDGARSLAVAFGPSCEPQRGYLFIVCSTPHSFPFCFSAARDSAMNNCPVTSRRAPLKNKRLNPRAQFYKQATPLGFFRTSNSRKELKTFPSSRPTSSTHSMAFRQSNTSDKSRNHFARR